MKFALHFHRVFLLKIPSPIAGHHHPCCFLYFTRRDSLSVNIPPIKKMCTSIFPHYASVKFCQTRSKPGNTFKIRWQTVHGSSPFCSCYADKGPTKNSAATGVFASEDASGTSSANTCPVGEGGRSDLHAREKVLHETNNSILYGVPPKEPGFFIFT